jgi:hypothetical protein
VWSSSNVVREIKLRIMKWAGYAVCSLFNDAFSVTRLYSADDRISEWWWIGKDLVGSSRGLILRCYPRINLEEQRSYKKNSVRSLDRDLNPGPPEYEAVVLTTGPRRLVRSHFAADAVNRLVLVLNPLLGLMTSIRYFDWLFLHLGRPTRKVCGPLQICSV